jgi:hypothetical protein
MHKQIKNTTNHQTVSWTTGREQAASKGGVNIIVPEEGMLTVQSLVTPKRITWFVKARGGQVAMAVQCTQSVLE